MFCPNSSFTRNCNKNNLHIDIFDQWWTQTLSSGRGRGVVLITLPAFLSPSVISSFLTQNKRGWVGKGSPGFSPRSATG